MGYKKYIQDYRKEYIVKPNGKPGVTAVYVGKYYNYLSDRTSFVKARTVYSLLSALALACGVIPLFFNTEAMHTAYVSLPCVIALFPLVHLVFGVYNLYVKKTPMIREFRDKTEGRITSSSAVSICVTLLAALCWVIKCITSSFGMTDVISIVLLLISSAAAGYMFLGRKVFATVEIENQSAEKE